MIDPLLVPKSSKAQLSHDRVKSYFDYISMFKGKPVGNKWFSSGGVMEEVAEILL